MMSATSNLNDNTIFDCLFVALDPYRVCLQSQQQFCVGFLFTSLKTDAFMLCCINVVIYFIICFVMSSTVLP